MKKIIYLVIAGDYEQYKGWEYFAKKMGDYGSSKFIDDINKLYGYTPEGAEIVLTGEYWKNPAYNSNRFVHFEKRFVIIKPN